MLTLYASGNRRTVQTLDCAGLVARRELDALPTSSSFVPEAFLTSDSSPGRRAYRYPYAIAE